MDAARAAFAAGLALLSGGVALAQETTRVSVESSGIEGNDDSGGSSISADGRFVTFAGRASDLVSNDSNGCYDVFVHDRVTGITERVSIDSSGVEGDRDSSLLGRPSMSADGRFVAFDSRATNLVNGDVNGTSDAFVHDRATGLTERVSVNSSGAEGNGYSDSPSISADGRFVAFRSSSSNLVAGDSNGLSDVFVHDRTTGLTERVSVNSSGAEADWESSGAAISADAQIIAFTSGASNLVANDTNGTIDVFVHDRTTGVTERVSVDSFGVEANGYSHYPSISSDGQVVAFSSGATNLIANDTNGFDDVFVHDRLVGITERVSVDSSGAEGQGGSVNSSISADGQSVAFDSAAPNLVSGDTDSHWDVFVHDRSTGTTEQFSVDSVGADGNRDSAGPSISGNGRVVAFVSDATNLVAGDTNGVPSFTAQSNPVLGSNLTLDLANSYGHFTFGLLFVGFQQTSIHSGWGGDLLVVPLITIVVGLGPSGTSIGGDIPYDGSICGLKVDLQAIEADPGAAKGVSFTPGLELVLGH